MRILYYLKYKDIPMFQWQKHHIFNELAAHNIEIELFNPLDFGSFEESNENLLVRLQKGGINIFMTTSTEDDLFIQTIQDIKALGIPTLLICFDNLTVPFSHKIIAPYFDLVWLTSIETKYLFDKWGVKSIFLPYAANPEIGKGNFAKDIERVLFIGTPYGSRCKMLNNLLDADVPVSLYANSITVSSNFMPRNENGNLHLAKEIVRMLSYPIGRRLAYASLKNKLSKQSVLHADSQYLIRHSAVSVDEMMTLYNQYALSLSSVSNRHTGVLCKPVFIVNLRSFEIPAAGGLLFCLFNPELNQYFEDGKEAVYYQNDEDMIDKAKFYLSPTRRNLRESIKRSAMEKARNEHSWYCRFEKIFSLLGMDTDASIINYIA